MRTSQFVVGDEGGRPVSELLSVIESIAPKSLADKGDCEGLLFGQSSDLFSKVGVVWDLTVDNLREMVNKGVDLVIAHTYPFSNNKKSLVREDRLEGYDVEFIDDTDELKKRLLKEFKMALVRVHTSWDNAVDGNNDVLAQLLGLSMVVELPLARVGTVSKVSLENYAFKVKRVLGAPHVKVVGKLHSPVSKVMVVAGRGLMFTEFVDYCVVNGVNVIVSGDATKRVARYANDHGVALIDAGARVTEVPGMKELAKCLWDHGFKADFYETKELFSYV